MSSMEMSVTQRLSQQQKLSPQMIQTIGILAMPMDQLRERIYEEVESNPAIEIIRDPVYVSSTDSDTHQRFLESVAQPAETLQDHLLLQLSEKKVDEKIQNLAERVIGNLDSRGYFLGPCENLLAPDEKSSFLREAVELVQSFDPIGVCCENLQESLLLQAKAIETAPPLAVIILRDFFPLLEKTRPQHILDGIAEQDPLLARHYSLKTVKEALDFIQTLNPYPAQQYSDGGSVSYVEPDAFIRKSTDEEIESGADEFIVEMLKGSLPEIGVSKDFKDMASSGGDTGKFVSDSIKKADWFINAVQQRTMTVYNALRVIVGKQSLFFYKGPGYLVPLRMQEVADAIDVHPATISRIANGKFIRCEWGFFEIRYFFTNSVATDGDGPSKESVKQEISKILSSHESSGTGKKLSDEKIVQRLAERGIKIARRTVAKYRAELNIKSSFERL
ncbi:MAG: RNA polymerase factor sigma-54 [Treponemataceae bacterium]|nr:RNA polymerase factor sigma-54 [Treponemataceae bacterium]